MTEVWGWEVEVFRWEFKVILYLEYIASPGHCGLHEALSRKRKSKMEWARNSKSKALSVSMRGRVGGRIKCESMKCLEGNYWYMLDRVSLRLSLPELFIRPLLWQWSCVSWYGSHWLLSEVPTQSMIGASQKLSLQIYLKPVMKIYISESTRAQRLQN